MDTLKSLVSNLAFILLLAVFLEMLLPNNTMRGFVRLIMGFFVIAAVLQPVTALLKMPTDDLFRPWTQSTAQSSAVLPEGQSSNPGKDATREQYRKILQTQIRMVVESVAQVAKIDVEVELGNDGDGYMDYPPILKISVDLYKTVSAIDLIDPVATVTVGEEAPAQPQTKPATVLEQQVGDKLAQALQVSRDIIEVREK